MYFDFCFGFNVDIVKRYFWFVVSLFFIEFEDKVGIFNNNNNYNS